MVGNNSSSPLSSIKIDDAASQCLEAVTSTTTDANGSKNKGHLPNSPLSPTSVYSSTNPKGQRIVWVHLPGTPRWPGRVVADKEVDKPALQDHDKVRCFFSYFIFSSFNCRLTRNLHFHYDL